MIYLLRHQKTYNNLKGIISGQSESTIIEGNINKNQKYMISNINCIYSSPSKRCLDTLRNLTNMRPIIDDRLLERDMGIFEGKKKEEIMQKYPGYFKNKKFSVFMTPPEGEAYDIFYRRIFSFYEELIKDVKEDILICGHNQALKVLKAILQSEEVTQEYWAETNFENGTIIKYNET